jgi:hypothetical protein
MHCPRLSCFLYAECGLGLLQVERSDNAQIPRGAQLPVHKEAVHDDVTAVRRCRKSWNHFVGDRGTETIMTAFSVKPEQMIAIGIYLDAP